LWGRERVPARVEDLVQRKAQFCNRLHIAFHAARYDRLSN
jgi:hypothetical protein